MLEANAVELPCSTVATTQVCGKVREGEGAGNHARLGNIFKRDDGGSSGNLERRTVTATRDGKSPGGVYRKAGNG